MKLFKKSQGWIGSEEIASDTIDFEDGDNVIVGRLGSNTPGTYRGVVRGIYGCDADDHPNAYIVEMVDPIPGIKNSCAVFPRGCVDSANLIS